jgi:transposase
LRLANMPPCLIGMEACVGAHHLSRKLQRLGHDARLMPAKYVRPYSKGQKNDFRDAEAIAEAVQRPTMKFVATKTADQLDLQALHRVRERLVSQRTGIMNQIRAFLLERGVAVRQGQRFLRAELPRILATPPDVLSPRMVRVIEELVLPANILPFILAAPRAISRATLARIIRVSCLPARPQGGLPVRSPSSSRLGGGP